MERRLGGTGLCWGWTGLWTSFPYPGTGFSLLHDRTDHLWIPTRLRWVVDQPVLKGLRPTGLLSGGTPCQPHPRSRPLRVLETETPLPPNSSSSPAPRSFCGHAVQQAAGAALEPLTSSDGASSGFSVLGHEEPGGGTHGLDTAGGAVPRREPQRGWRPPSGWPGGLSARFGPSSHVADREVMSPNVILVYSWCSDCSGIPQK